MQHLLSRGSIAPTDIEVALLRSKEWWDWRNSGSACEDLWTVLEFPMTPSPDAIPVGSVEFVRNYVKEVCPESEEILLKPLGIPECIGEDLLGRRVLRISSDYIPKFEDDEPVEWYCKSMSEVKCNENGWKRTGDSLVGSGPWLLSEKLKTIKGEFRVFLDRYGSIQDVRNYIGWEEWPDSNKLYDISRALYSTYHRPLSFDVVVTSLGETYFLEAHDYWALGLYGYEDPQKLPYFINDWWKQKNKEKRYERLN